MLFLLPTRSFVAYDNDFGTDERAWNPEVWAAETLMLLEENMVIGGLVHTDFSNEVSSFGDTVNTRLPGAFTAKRKGTNDDVSVQAASAARVQVVLNQHVHTSFMIRDGEESRSFVELVDEYLRPAAQSLARHVDRALLGQVYQFRANQVGGATAGTIKTLILKAREKQNVLKVPVENRNLILTPGTETEALELDLFLAADNVGDEGTALREASLGKKLGYQTFMCQNCPGLATGTSTTTSGVDAGSVDGAHSAGDVAITTITDSTGVLTPGMYVSFEGDTGIYRVTAVAATLVTLDKGLLNDIADEAEVTYYTLGVVDLTGDAAATAYPIGYAKDINITAAGVIPQVGQLVAFSTSADALRDGEYCIVAVDDGSGAGDYYITLDRPLDVALANIDKVAYGPAKDYNFAFDRDALALVSRPLALPRAGAGATAGVSQYNNMAIRIVITYDGTAQGHLVTLDMLCGVKVLDVNRGVMMVR